MTPLRTTLARIKDAGNRLQEEISALIQISPAHDAHSNAAAVHAEAAVAAAIKHVDGHEPPEPVEETTAEEPKAFDTGAPTPVPAVAQAD